MCVSAALFSGPDKTLRAHQRAWRRSYTGQSLSPTINRCKACDWRGLLVPPLMIRIDDQIPTNIALRRGVLVMVLWRQFARLFRNDFATTTFAPIDSRMIWHRVCILYRRRRRWISSDVPGIYTKPYVSRYTAAPRERRAALTQSHWEMITPSRRLSPVSDTGSTGLTRAASEPPRPNHFTGCDSDSAATGSRIIPSV